MRNESSSLWVRLVCTVWVGVLCTVGPWMLGCGDRSPAKPRTEQLDVARAIEKQVEEGPLRFTVEANGFFHGGYENHKREIFVITDRRTGKEYLAITGAGVTELWTEEETHTRLVPDGQGGVTVQTETIKKTVEE